MIPARALLAAFVLASFAFAAPRAPQLALNLGIGRNVFAGRGFDIGWLGASLEYAVHSAAGYGGLAALGGLAVIATLALVEWRARARAGNLLALAATVIAAFAFLDVLRVAGGGASWLAAAALLVVLERAPGRRVFWAIPIAFVWCNLSAQGIVAPLIVALVALGTMLDEGYDAPTARRLWLVALGCAVATVLTPAGFEFVAAAPLAARLDRNLLEILPLAPNALAPVGYRTAFFAIVVGGAALGLSQRRAVDGLLLAAGIVLTLLDGAFLPVLGIIAAPILAGNLARMLPQFAAAAQPRERKAGVGVAIFAIAAVALAIGINLRANVALAERAAPQDLIERLAADGRPHSLFCSALEWCDYAIGASTVHAWMDGRVERSSLATRDVQRIVARVETDWPKRLRASGIDTLVVRKTDALATLLALSHEWYVRDGDETAQLFVRRAGILK